MRDLGIRLQKAREAKGFTLDQIQEMTKIRLLYLEAIEAGDWSVLPGRFYAKMFIKTYAEALDLPVEEMLQAVKAELDKQPETNRTQSVVVREDRPQWLQTIVRLAPTIAAWTMILLVIVVTYSWLTSSEKATVNDPVASPERLSQLGQAEMEDVWDVATATPEPTATPPTNIEDPSGVSVSDGLETLQSAMPESTEPPLEGATTANGVYKYTSSDASEFADDAAILSSADLGSGVDGFDLSDTAQVNVLMELTGEACWLEVREDSRRGARIKLGKEVFLRGETIELHSIKPLYIKLGNPSAVKLMVNGQMIDTGTEQKPRTFGFQIASN